VDDLAADIVDGGQALGGDATVGAVDDADHAGAAAVDLDEGTAVADLLEGHGHPVEPGGRLVRDRARRAGAEDGDQQRQQQRPPGHGAGTGATAGW
jgi:hypothetical protein